MQQKNIPRTMNAWAFYDWANSVYSLIITTSIFPIYYATVLENSNRTIMGFSHQAAYSFSIGISFLIVIILSPILSAIADIIGNKRLFLRGFCTLGSLGCAGLYFFTSPQTVYVGILCSMVASVGFWGSLVFYNSYLPDIATQDRQDNLSAKGFALGYIGSAILLMICLSVITFHQTLSIDKAMATRVSFLLVAVWWFGFAQYTLYKLPKGNRRETNIKNHVFVQGFQEMLKVQKKLFSDSNKRNFLLSFFCYSVGVQTIFYLAVPFGKNDLKIESINLIITILAMQFVAVVGAQLYAWLSNRKGNKRALQGALCLWLVVCVLAYYIEPTHVYAAYFFYVLAALVALVMGGIQSLSRSTYAKLIPQEKTTTFFSFYDIIEKIAIVLGTFLIGLAIEAYGNMRIGILSMALFFAMGLFFIGRYREIKSDK